VIANFPDAAGVFEGVSRLRLFSIGVVALSHFRFPAKSVA